VSLYLQLLWVMLACGATCGWLAERKGERVGRWFVLGSLLGGFAAVVLYLQPPSAKPQADPRARRDA